MSDEPIVQEGSGVANFIRDHFSVLVVFLVFMILGSLYFYELHWGRTLVSVDWLESKMSDVIAAILMGVSAQKVQSAVKNGNGNGK